MRHYGHVDIIINFTYNRGVIFLPRSNRGGNIITNMPETTPAFEAYLKDLENNTLPKKGRVGKLATALDELAEKEEEEPGADIAA